MQEQFSEKRGCLRQCKMCQRVFVTMFLVWAIVCFFKQNEKWNSSTVFSGIIHSSNWKRLGTIELDNCLDLCWQLWLSRITGLKSISADLTSLAVFVIDAHRIARTMMRLSPSVIKEGCHFTHIAIIWGHVWIVEAMKLQHGQSRKFSHLSHVTRSRVNGQGNGY